MVSWRGADYQKDQPLIRCLEFPPHPNDGACLRDEASIKSLKCGVGGAVQVAEHMAEPCKEGVYCGGPTGPTTVPSSSLPS